MLRVAALVIGWSSSVVVIDGSYFFFVPGIELNNAAVVLLSKSDHYRPVDRDG